MKRLSITIIMLLTVIIGIDAQRTFVLLTGVSNYGGTEGNLHNTTKDVKELAVVFKNQNASVTTLTSRYANVDNIKQKLNAIITVAKPEDKIIFYFSGHGMPGAFCTYQNNHFPYTDLIDILSAAKTNKVFCFIDACMSGSVAEAGGGSYAWGQTSASKMLTFCMSSRADEYSLENLWLGNGYFTQAMIKGLRGMADANGDKKITLMELYTYIYKDVTTRVGNSKDQQHPQLIGPKSNYGTVLAKW